MSQRVDKPWGYELWWARTDRYVGKILHVKAGESLSLQYHNVKDETILIQAGRLRFETRAAGEVGPLAVKEMNPGDVFHITPGTVHRMTALDDVDARAQRRGPPGRPLRAGGHLEAVRIRRQGTGSGKTACRPQPSAG